jgi:serine protease Do
VALVKIPATGLPILKYADSDSARVGDLCFAIGNPFGQDHTVTMGIVSAKGRKLEGPTYLQNFIQTDAAINPGNSGGALLNSRGELIGMNTAILSGGSSFGGEGGNIGIGFAVPANMARQVTDQLMKSGKVTRGYMGVSLQQLSNEQAPFFGLKDGKGAIVAQVNPKGPGAKAGLQTGDVITAIDGKKVDGSDDLTMAVVAKAPGSTATLDVMRNSQPMKVQVTLGQRPGSIDFDKPKSDDDDNASPDDNSSNANADVTVRGITVEALTPEVAQQIGAPASLRGVVVSDIDQSGPAGDKLGKGLVITAVDRKPVTSPAEFKRLMSQAEGKAVLLTITAQGVTSFAVVQPK